MTEPWDVDFWGDDPEKIKRRHPWLYRQFLEAEGTGDHARAFRIWCQSVLLADWKELCVSAAIGCGVGLIFAAVLQVCLLWDRYETSWVPDTFLAAYIALSCTLFAVQCQFSKGNDELFFVELERISTAGATGVDTIRAVGAKLLGVACLFIVTVLVVGALAGVAFLGLMGLSELHVLRGIPEAHRTYADFTMAIRAGALAGVPVALFLIGLNFLDQWGTRATERRAKRLQIPEEQLKALQRATGALMIKGALLGGVGALLVAWIGIIPVGELAEWWTLIIAGAFYGALALGSTARSPLITPSDQAAVASLHGSLIGGVVGFAASAAIIWVITGTYKADYNEGWGIGGAILGGAIAGWRRSASLNLYPRTRFVAGAILSACIGAGLLFGSVLLGAVFPPVGQVWQTVVRTLNITDAALLIRGIPVVGALLGFGVFAWWRWGRRGSASRRMQWSAAGEAANEFTTTVSKVGAFVRGSIWVVVAVVIWRIGSWWWATLAELGTVSEIAGYVIYGGSIVALARGFLELLPALKGRPRLKNQGVYGQSRNATLDEAHQATRSTGGPASVDDRHF